MYMIQSYGSSTLNMHLYMYIWYYMILYRNSEDSRPHRKQSHGQRGPPGWSSIMAVPKHPHLFTGFVQKWNNIPVYNGINFSKTQNKSLHNNTSGCQGYIRFQDKAIKLFLEVYVIYVQSISIHFNPVQHDHFMPDLSQTGHSIHWDPGKVDRTQWTLMHDQQIRTSCWTNLAQYPAPNASLVAPGPKALWI